MRRFAPSLSSPRFRGQGDGPKRGGGGCLSHPHLFPEKRRAAHALTLLPLLALAACAEQAATAVQPGAPGFLHGLWHGFIFPVAWVISLFMKDVSIYAVPNNGGWYDFGYFLGIVVFGVGARKSHTVTRDRIVRVR